MSDAHETAPDADDEPRAPMTPLRVFALALLAVAVIAIAIVIGVSIAGSGDAGDPRAAAVAVLSTNPDLTPAQVEASADAAVTSATARCETGEEAPSTGDATFDEAVAAAMGIICK